MDTFLTYFHGAFGFVIGTLCGIAVLMVVLFAVGGIHLLWEKFNDK